MKIRRRDFLKGIVGGAAAVAVSSPGTIRAEAKERKPGQLGILYDATLCIGCQVCVTACKQANNMPPVRRGELELWENPLDLSADTLNIIKKYENGTGQQKDRTVNGFAYIKRQCLHCVDPACVSACPASAMTKDPETGIVSYDKEACVGCRYCQIACQYNIPKFEWNKAFPKIVKCQLCSHLIVRGGIAACCGHCPTGASLFGPVADLRKETARRKQMTPGSHYQFPVASIDSGKTAVHKAAVYIDHIYGEKEIGGSQVLLMSGVPFDLLGLPDLPDESYVAQVEKIQHTLYGGLMIPVAVLGGLIILAAKNSRNKEE